MSATFPFCAKLPRFVLAADSRRRQGSGKGSGHGRHLCLRLEPQYESADMARHLRRKPGKLEADRVRGRILGRVHPRGEVELHQSEERQRVHRAE